MRFKYLLWMAILLGCSAYAQAREVNYAEALQKSLYFYDAEKSGPGISGGRLTWRGDSETVDMAVPMNEEMTNMSAEFIQANKAVLDPDGDGTVDVSGGYHDAGDHVKFGLPQTYSSSTLEWALYEFKEAFVRIGEYDHMVELMRWFSDYYLRSTFRNSAGDVVAFCYQVGEGSVDHNFWGPPELIDHVKYPRPAYFATAETPASDQAAGAAASLALTYLNQKEDDPVYAQKCLETAIALYEFAVKHRGLGYSGGFYNSAYDEDELSWAAVWLHIATGEHSYLDDIIAGDDQGLNTGWLAKIIRSSEDDWQNGWVHCWDVKWGGVFAKLAPITDDPEHWKYFRWNIEFWSGVPHQDSSGGSFLGKTPAGFSYISTWGSARYNAAAQFTGMVYKKYTASDVFDDWMVRQMNYIMGDNPLNRSYIVGYGDNYASHPHHRAAHGSSTNDMTDPPEHKHILWGALVGGPGPNDEHVDKTDDFIYNEVAIDYNAGLVGALAGHLKYFGQGHQPIADFPPADPRLKEYKVEGKLEQDNSQRSQVTLRVTNESAFPPRKEVVLSARYFFDISELLSHGQSISSVKLEVYYDENKLSSDAVTARGPLAWDAQNGIYYVEFTWPESGFYGTRELQFALVAGQDANYTDHWDPSNDYSHRDLESDYVESQKISLYVNGKYYFGVEPGGQPPTDTQTATDTNTNTAPQTDTNTQTEPDTEIDTDTETVTETDAGSETNSGGGCEPADTPGCGGN